MDIMNRSYFALFVALLIHFLFILLFWIFGLLAPDIQKTPEPKEKKIKISLRELPKKHKKTSLKKEKAIPSPVAPPMPKGSQLKKISKAPTPVKYEPKSKPKKQKLNPKPKPKVIKQEAKPLPKVKPLPPKKPYILLREEQKKEIVKKKPIDPLYAMLSEDKSQEYEVRKTKKRSRFGAGGSIREMKKLYGSKWGKLSPAEQEYLLDNTEVMRRITQEVLNRQARVSDINDINVNKSNVIEFYLHPNGDMSDFKFLSKSGYYILDDLTKTTIGYAYSKYPRPKEKTLIRYNVFYNLRRF